MACPSDSSCLAAGGSNAYTIDLETGVGDSWTSAEAPLPANSNPTTPGAEFGGMACASTSMCVVVGEYYDSDENFDGLILTGPG